MVRRTEGPVPPRTASPDLPPVLNARSGLAPRDDLFGVRVGGLAGDVSAAHGRLTECRLDPASVEQVDLTGATLTDVVWEDVRAVTFAARDGAWRNVELDGGRIATVDALRGRWENVTVRAMRIDYLSLASAELSDVRFVACRIGTLDLPEAHLARVQFEDTRADEVDTRGVRCSDVDLRGLEAATYTDPRGLAGATLAPRQAELHAPAFAQALGIRLLR